MELISQYLDPIFQYIDPIKAGWILALIILLLIAPADQS